MIITTADFVGKYKAGGTNFAALQSYIDRYEAILLRELLGVELYELFKTAYIADNTLVATPIYKAIYDAIAQDNDEGCEPKVIQNNGMKQMLVGMVWFYFVRDLVVKMTNAGPVNDQSEVSEMANPTFMYQYYNEAVHDWKVIQWYIDENSTDYPTFNGIDKSIAHWSI